VKGAEQIEPAGGSSGRRVLRAWTYVAVWAGVVLLASSPGFSATQTERWLWWIARLLFENVPSSELDMVNAMLRKTAHFVEYAILGLLAHRACLLTWGRRRYAFVLVGALLLALLCAGLDEWHQHFLPQRTGSLRDILLDLCGASVGVFAHLLHVRAGSPRWVRAPFALRGSASS
jgi:VanZ family protein